MARATSNREGWFTSVFHERRLDLPLAKPTTAESKPIRGDQRARVDGSVVIAIFKLRHLSIASRCRVAAVPFAGHFRIENFHFLSFLPSFLFLLLLIPSSLYLLTILMFRSTLKMRLVEVNTNGSQRIAN